jgi:hypothetical protein
MMGFDRELLSLICNRSAQCIHRPEVPEVRRFFWSAPWCGV